MPRTKKQAAAEAAELREALERAPSPVGPAGVGDRAAELLSPSADGAAHIEPAESLVEPRKDSAPPATASGAPPRAVPCFILDGNDVDATPRVLAALLELGHALCENFADADQERFRKDWASARMRLGDPNRETVSFQFGAIGAFRDRLEAFAVTSAR